MRRPILLATAALAGLVVASTGALSATAVPLGTRTAITVDCIEGEGSNDNQLILPGEFLTITLLNCIGATVNDDDATGNLYDATDTPANTFLVTTSPYVFKSLGASDIEVYDDPDYTYDLDIDVYVATEAAVPSGFLNLTTRVTIPQNAPAFAIGLDEIDYVGNTYANDGLLGGDPECNMEPGYHPYQTMQITVSENGDYTFRVIDASPVDEDVQWGAPYFPNQDLFLAVYTTFDPANPDSNIVGCNDDRDDDNVYAMNGGTAYLFEDQTPEFTATLAPGTYTLVLTFYRTSSAAEFAAGEFSPWSGVAGTTWDPQPLSGLFELWGPAGSITAGAPVLAATGRDDASLALVTGVGVLLVLAGGGAALYSAASASSRARSARA